MQIANWKRERECQSGQSHFAAVDGMLKPPCQSHVVIGMEVRQEVGGAIGYRTIAECIHREPSTCVKIRNLKS